MTNKNIPGRLARLAVLAIPALAIIACGSSPQSQSSAGSQKQNSGNPSSDEPLLHRTVVVFNADHSQTVTESWITRAEQLAEQATRHAQAEALAAHTYVPDLTHDDNCTNPNDVLLWDTAGESGNEICFRNAGTVPNKADLANFTETTYWCGGMEFSKEWYGIGECGGMECDDCSPTANHVKYIEGGGSEPQGCFNESTSPVQFGSYPYFNFASADLPEAAGSSVASCEYLWLDVDGNDSGGLCYDVF